MLEVVRPGHRVVSLLPGGTEVVAALGAEDLLVGVTHECDYPLSVRELPRVTWTPIDSRDDSGGIDAQVRAVSSAGQAVIAVDATLLEQLRPTLILTQTLCDVCAVADGQVLRLADLMPAAPQVLALAGRTLAGVYSDISQVGAALARADSAARLIAGMQERMSAVRSRSTRRMAAPRVLCIEWLEPPFLAGHWVPDLVEIAGGTNVGAESGSHSRQLRWPELYGLEADIIIVMLCGFGLERARTEIGRCAPAAEWLERTGSAVWIMDGNAYTSRPGPRLVEGAECIAASIAGRNHPGIERW